METTTDKLRRSYDRQRKAAWNLRAAFIKILEAKHTSGRLLNAVYTGPIPPKDLAAFATIDARAFSPRQCALMRALARKCTVDRLPSLADQFGSWGRITAEYLPDLPAEEMPAAVDKVSA